MKFNNVIPFRVDSKTFAIIEEHCEVNNLKRSTFIRDVVVEYFNKKEATKNGKKRKA